MVIVREFPYYSVLFGLVSYNAPCFFGVVVPTKTAVFLPTLNSQATTIDLDLGPQEKGEPLERREPQGEMGQSG